jgi:hypothetical protein
MRTTATLLTGAAALAIGFAVPAYAQSIETPGAKSDITIAADTTMPPAGAGSVQTGGPNSEDQGGTGVKGSAQSEGANNKNSAAMPSTGAGSTQTGGMNSEDQGGTGVKGSAQSEGANNKNSAPMAATGAGSAQTGGMNSEDEGGTGVKGSAQSEGANNKNSTY